MSNFAKSDLVLELWNIISQWEFIRGAGVSEPCDSFIFHINVNERGSEVIGEVGPIS